jgi:hypothetical protein
MYVNGVQSGSSAQNAGTPATGTATGAIGGDWSGGSNYNGTIDDVRVYNRALSASDVTALYNTGGAAVTTALDSSGNGNTGTLVNAPTWTTGKINGALSFNGSSTTQYVDAGNPALLQITGSITITAWIYMTSVNCCDRDDVIINKDLYPTSDGYSLRGSQDCTGVNLQDNLLLSISTTSRCSNTVLATNTWYFVAGVYDVPRLHR